jgi:hypothetical protein
MFKGKNLLYVALGAGAIYWYYTKMKKDKAAKALAAKAAAAAAARAENGFTGSYFNATGMPNVNASGMPCVNMYGGRNC